jgi:hypothetical protein
VKIICFSANASFTAGIALLAIGAVTLSRARSRQELPFASVPMIFGVQQLVAGSLWLGLPAQTATTHGLAIAYLLFSHVLWPILVPVAVWLIEPGAVQRKRMIFLLAAGTATGLFFLYAMITQPVFAAIKGAHISYNLPHPYDPVALSFYVAATCIAPLLSSHRTVRLFGLVLIGSMIATYVAYVTWFASVWCFFAALTSSTVFLHFLGRTAPSTGEAANSPS